MTDTKRKVRTLEERISDKEAELAELKHKKNERDAKAAEKARRADEKDKSYTDEKAAKKLLRERRRLEQALSTLADIGQGESEAADDIKTQLEVVAESLKDLEEE